MIPVTRPFIPPQHEYEQYLKGIWDRNWLTNGGPLVNELEIALKRKLNVPHILFTGNGTIALQMAIRALGLTGEIITTPFSYVATVSSIVWEGCTPVFVDIDPESLNIDVDKIEAAITKKTSAILATHVYGNPCDIDAIRRISHKHKLRVIYDAAHCFGTLYKGKSVFSFGDISATSFHSTKIFSTVEGGALFSKNSGTIKKLSYIRNFGHAGPERFEGLGINGKNSEFHAAMGLANLKYVDEILARRRELSEYYDYALRNLRVRRPILNQHAHYNYSYYPIIFSSTKQLEKSIMKLNNTEIFPRRYFYPLLTRLPYVKKVKLPVAEGIAEKVLCLPLYHTLSHEEIDLISRLLLRVQNYGG